MARPQPTLVYHFTHIAHLATVVQRGLVSDSLAREAGVITVEVGNQDIKERRRNTPVTVAPHGTVADYVPFYYAPRSPMMYAIWRGNVGTYQDGCDNLIYLVTSVERLIDAGSRSVFTDRNAVLTLASYTTSASDLDQLIDWSLMDAKLWFNTPEQPDRRERRMAECLVHESVAWDTVLGIAVRDPRREQQVVDILAAQGVSTAVRVRPEWYF